MIETNCRNYGRTPDCVGTIDERYDMDFTDVPGGEVLHWCAACGPREKEIRDRLVEDVMASPENMQKLKDAMVECTHRKEPS